VEEGGDVDGEGVGGDRRGLHVDRQRLGMLMETNIAMRFGILSGGGEFLSPQENRPQTKHTSNSLQYKTKLQF
jgi:hypothetical protein